MVEADVENSGAPECNMEIGAILDKTLETDNLTFALWRFDFQTFQAEHVAKGIGQP